MARILVIGYGNTLRGDDALGPLAAERLQPQVFPAETVACHQLTPELAAQIGEYDGVLFIDAAAEGEPGTVRVQTVSPAEADEVASLTHHASPRALLALARELYGRAPQALLISTMGENFALRATEDAPLSASATRALEEICQQVVRLVRDFPRGW